MYSVQSIGTRGILVSFDDLVLQDGDPPTNIFIIQTDTKVFICDTYLGPAAMLPVVDRYVDPAKTKIIINSHHHWDHVWGNCTFPADIIISHRLCRELMANDGEKTLLEKAKYALGDVSLTLPTLTFDTALSFPEEGIKLFHSPGHTADSISVFDEIDDTLFAADNIELPFPLCTISTNIQLYQQTLCGYQRLNPRHLIPGHGSLFSRTDLAANLHYLGGLDSQQLHD